MRVDEAAHEVCIVVLRGRVSVTSGDHVWRNIGERDSVFEARAPYAAYVPTVQETFEDARRYWWRVRAVDTVGNASESPIGTFDLRTHAISYRLDNELSEVFEFRAYSSDLSLAWEVVERLSGTVNTLRVKRERNRWVAAFGDGPAVSASSAPVAICMAALRTRGIEVDFDQERTPWLGKDRVAA